MGLFGRLLPAAEACGYKPSSNLKSRFVDARLPLQALDSLTVMPPLLSVTHIESGALLDLGMFSLKNNQLESFCCHRITSFVKISATLKALMLDGCKYVAGSNFKGLCRGGRHYVFWEF